MEIDVYVDGVSNAIRISKCDKWHHDACMENYKFFNDNNICILMVPENKLLAVHRIDL